MHKMKESINMCRKPSWFRLNFSFTFKCNNLKEEKTHGLMHFPQLDLSCVEMFLVINGVLRHLVSGWIWKEEGRRGVGGITVHKVMR